MKADNLPSIKIERPIYEHNQLREDLKYKKTKKSHKWCKNISCRKIITSVVPSLGWIPNYERTDFFSDLATGFTVAIMHIPQGMAYALLGNVPPVVGIYMAVFPVLVYFFFGSSRHVSMGTFSIACLMTGKAVLEYSDPVYFKPATTNGTDVTFTSISPTYSPSQVASAVTLVVAFIQLIMYFLRLGIASALLSEMLVNAFTAGAAAQIVITQCKDLIGITIPKVSGNFLAINTLTVLFENIGNYNVAAIVISSISIVILVINNEILKPIVAKKSKIPIPIELIVVVIGSIVSNQFELPKLYSIKTVGNIPSGLPSPALPPLSLIPNVLVDGFSVAIVSYVTSMSLALILAQKANYEIDANQELLAMGTSNIVGSLFTCMPVCASLSRSMIQQVVGGKTQFVSVFSALLLIITLLWIGPFFEPLPRSVLASVIVVSLKGMLMQITQVVKFWSLNKLDAIVWMVTFITVVVISMEIGLLVGICMSLFSIFIFSFKPCVSLLGSVPGTELYLDITRYNGAIELDGIKIFHYCGVVNFATKNVFREELYKTIDFNAQKELVLRAKLDKYQNKFDKSATAQTDEKLQRAKSKIKSSLKCLIVDFSSVNYLDPGGAAMLKTEINNFRKLNILFYLTSCSDRVYNMILRCDVISKDNNLRIFSSIHDAVKCAVFNIGPQNGLSEISQ